MSPGQVDRSPVDPPPLPVVPLAVWALAVLAYPVLFLGRLVTYPDVVQTAFFALPDIVLEGFFRLHVLLAAALLWAIAVGTGMALLRRAGYEGLSLAERAVFGGGIGMGMFSLGTFLAGMVGGRPQWLLAALLAALLAGMACLGAREFGRAFAAGVRGLDAWRRQASLGSGLAVMLGVAAVGIALARANVPIVADYDSLEYHLAAPAQWWRAGHVSFIRDVVYSNFPLNAEMLYLLTMTCLGGPVLGAVAGLQVGVGFVLLTAGAVAACGRRLDSPGAGRAGAAVFLATPMLAELGSHNSYVVELPQTAYTFLSLFAFLLLRGASSRAERWRYAGLCGAMIGLTIGCKYPAVLFVLAPILAFIVAGGIVRLSTLRSAVLTAAGVGLAAILVASPWLIRNAVNTGNPTYPLLYSVFGGRNWTPEQEVKFAKAHAPSDMRLLDLGDLGSKFNRKFWAFAVWRDQYQGDWGPPWRPPASPLLCLLALLPIALADPRSTRAVVCTAVCFLGVAALARFAPGSLRSWPVAADTLLAAGVLALVTSPAFLVHRGGVLFLWLHVILCLIAWFTLTHQLDRFLDPVAPGIAVVAGIGVASLTEPRLRRCAQGLLVGGLAYAAATAFLIQAPLLWAGLTEPGEAFLRKAFEGSTYSQEAIEAINKELPAHATVLFVGESRTFYCERRVLAATVFDRGPIDRLLAESDEGDPARRVRDGLRSLGVTHLYVNWPEIGRLAGTYGFRFGGRDRKGLPDVVYARLFAEMTRQGYLRLFRGFGRDPQGRPRPVFILYELL